MASKSIKRQKMMPAWYRLRRRPMQRRVSKVPTRARNTGIKRSSVARLCGNPDSQNEAAKLPTTSRLPRSRDLRRGLKTANDERGRVKRGDDRTFGFGAFGLDFRLS